MTTFQLDTTGAVLPVNQDDPILSVQQGYTWLDLDAFTQGYIEALFAAHSIERTTGDGRVFSHGAFDMLAPETLARIISDCEDATARRNGWHYVPTTEGGREFWERRQRGGHFEYSPLTITLGDDGKARFA